MKKTPPIFIVAVLAVLLVLFLPTARAHAETGETSDQSINITASGTCKESGFIRLAKDIGRDYRNTFSRETALWYGAGLGVTGLVHLADDEISEALAVPSDPAFMRPGDIYGNLAFQFPLAAGWWAVGSLLGSAREAEVGRDLLRAQINSATWTYAIKFAVNRERPNGDKRSFPSGHATSTFATAMVMKEHYGWKVGVPFFIAAGYTAVTRVANEKHWASDVAFGAVIGMASARTVTIHLRKKKITLIPMAVPGGAGFALVPLN